MSKSQSLKTKVSDSNITFYRSWAIIVGFHKNTIRSGVEFAFDDRSALYIPSFN